MIRFEQVSKAYLGGRQALQGVDFHLRQGEMAFLTGHSGAGKSTLLKLICGIERPSAGHILLVAMTLAACVTAKCRFCVARLA